MKNGIILEVGIALASAALGYYLGMNRVLFAQRQLAVATAQKNVNRSYVPDVKVSYA